MNRRSLRHLAVAVVTSLLMSIDTAQVIITDDGQQTLTSSDGSFELGFFSPGNSKNRYVGIWYKESSNFPVAWVANRDKPITTTTNPSSAAAALKLAGNNLLLLDGNGTLVWSTTNHTSQQGTPKNPIVKLLNSGNLVIKEADDGDSPENYLWQSFDYPTDTLFPGMKLGWDFITGRETVLTSWKSADDPSKGDYAFRLEVKGYPQLVLERNGGEVFRSGAWNGEGFNGVPRLKQNGIYSYGLSITAQGAYYHYELLDDSIKSRFVLNYTGDPQRWTWAEKDRGWTMYLTAPTDECDYYNQCEGYGICNVANSAICTCLDRFVPKSPEKWKTTDWSDGCVRRTITNCKTDGFIRYTQIKLPDEKYASIRSNLSLGQCRDECLKDCSCVAYASLDVRNGGSGCLLWAGDLVDMRQLYGEEREIFIRMASSELGGGERRKKVLIAALSAFGAVFFLGIFVLTLFVRRRRKKTRPAMSERALGHYSGSSHGHEEMELPLFDLSAINKATDSFSLNNKLGEGGFGPVYKGILENGQEIAVKRLSRTSMQGQDEFKNEVIFIAKLQHRNLVKLHGCCIEGDEKMLVYEYMANRSLDSILFDPTLGKELDWSKRFQIITGIARGLMYLHQDSRLRIVHRDLKTSNILLDSNMNPKISDFGMARTFGGNDVEGNTSRVAGTYGYMSPEYAIDGMFSVKSDVFSFGVIVLEILSGKRNRGFVHAEHHHNLLGHGWILYKEGRSVDMIDRNLLGESLDSPDVVKKALHVGLLCVQQNPEDRPSMSSVVFMLENNAVLPQPKEPGFFTERNFFANDTSSFGTQTFSSADGVSITLPEAR